MIEEIFPGLGELTTLGGVCVCGCTASDPLNDDLSDDKIVELY
jgi:hypothetical protein